MSATDFIRPGPASHRDRPGPLVFWHRRVVVTNVWGKAPIALTACAAHREQLDRESSPDGPARPFASNGRDKCDYCRPAHERPGPTSR